MLQGTAFACLVGAGVMFVVGIFLMCYCPFWYLTAAALDGWAACRGSGGTRKLGLALTAASLAAAVWHARMEYLTMQHARLRHQQQVPQQSP
ncbi:MAG: hypothetical protein AB7I37_13195 [Pirellulales bacterium]